MEVSEPLNAKDKVLCEESHCGKKLEHSDIFSAVVLRLSSELAELHVVQDPRLSYFLFEHRPQEKRLGKTQRGFLLRDENNKRCQLGVGTNSFRICVFFEQMKFSDDRQQRANISNRSIRWFTRLGKRE